MNKNCDSSGRKCAEVTVQNANGSIARPMDGKFSVNDQTAGNVVGDGGVLRTTLKFFAWADKNHMPIRHMIVDFGDGIGKYDATGGPYPNRRGYKDAQLKNSYCDNSNFGQSSDACTARPISIEHTYQCVRRGNGWDQTENRGDGACVFHPRVYVEDNWGYCTGSCPGDPAGDKCFDGSDLSPQKANECDLQSVTPTKNPWVNFSGKVIVLPP